MKNFDWFSVLCIMRLLCIMQDSVPALTLWILEARVTAKQSGGGAMNVEAEAAATSLFVTCWRMVRMRPNASNKRSLGHGVRDPTDPAGDSLPVAAGSRSRVGPTVMSMGAEKEARSGFAAARYSTEGERRGPRRGQRAAADTAAGDYIACRRGTVSSYPRRPPCSDWPGSLPRKRTGFSFVSAHLRTSLGTLSSSLLSLSMSFLPIVYRSCYDTMRSSLFSSRYAGSLPSPSRKSHLAVLRRSTCPILVSVLSFYIPLPFFWRGPRRLPALVQFLNTTSGGPARKATIPFIPT